MLRFDRQSKTTASGFVNGKIAFQYPQIFVVQTASELNG